MLKHSQSVQSAENSGSKELVQGLGSAFVEYCNLHLVGAVITFQLADFLRLPLTHTSLLHADAMLIT